MPTRLRFTLLSRWHRGMLCAFIMSILASTVYAAPQVKEHQLKARYLEAFTLFIKWPDDSFSSNEDYLHLCVLGDNPFENALDFLARNRNKRKNRESNPLKIHYLHRGDDIKHCHALYFSDNVEQSYVYQVLIEIKSYPILTVSSRSSFVERGGMIQFYVRNNKVRFIIDPLTLRESGLKPDANLLRVANVKTQ